MSKRCPYRRRILEKDPKWIPLELNENKQLIDEINEKEGYVAYYRIPRFWVNEGKFCYYVVEDKIFEWIEKNYNNIKIVVACQVRQPMAKAWVQMKSQHDVNSMIDSDNDQNYTGIHILFRDVRDAAKFKMLFT